MKHPRAALASVATWLGIELDAAQVGLLVSYADWLVTEAATSGAIGPAEPDRIWDRHVLDALTFGHGLAGAASVIDVGTGAGLPGIPLAIAFPHTEVTLLDRSTSRTDALHRIARILGIPVRVVTADVRDHDGRYARVVMRAALPPGRAADLRRLALPGGDVVVGGSRGSPAPDPPDGAEVIAVDSPILENGAWLLRIPVE